MSTTTHRRPTVIRTTSSNLEVLAIGLAIIALALVLLVTAAWGHVVWLVVLGLVGVLFGTFIVVCFGMIHYERSTQRDNA